MLIPIPYGQSYTSHVSGSVTKLCRCEACAQEYLYTAARKVFASGMSFLWLDNEGARNRAVTGAQTQIRLALERAVDPVACPNCGWFQSNMKSQLKWRRLKWTLWIALPAAFFVLMTGIVRRSEPWLVGALITAVGGVVFGFVWSVMHDPNGDHGGPGGRNDIAAVRSRGTLRSVHEAQVAEQMQTFREECRDALLPAVVLVAIADGAINDAEVASIAQVSVISGGGVPFEAERIKLEAATLPSNGEEAQRRLTALAPRLSPVGKQMFLRCGIMIAVADGPINPQEQAALTLLSSLLKMTQLDVRTVVQSLQQPVA
jgi:tellurite resistance protein